MSDRVSTLPGVTDALEIGGTGPGGDAGGGPRAGSGDDGEVGGLVRRPLALSASRAADFRRCPLLYRLRAIDRIPEPRSRAQVLGTVVHDVLETLYGLDRPDRGPARAADLVGDAVEAFFAPGGGNEEGGLVVVPHADRDAFRAEAAALVATLYGVEDPQRFSPAACEQYLVTATAAGTPLHGYLDRVDVAPTGEVRVVDYKTGKPPRPAYRDEAMFQMRFYALMYRRIHGVLPTQLKLIYLKDGSWLTLSPDAEALAGTEATLDALWAAIESAGASGEFAPRTSRLCDWCAHQSLCPAFGGTPPEYPGWPGSRVVPVDVTPIERPGGAG
ncbi:MAG TPA: RecB family exonuclease [Actinomycetales bacterium]|nr:RecB family exonuclease [Actinomycetales bacterium]